MSYKLLIMNKPKYMGHMINCESCMVGETKRWGLND